MLGYSQAYVQMLMLSYLENDFVIWNLVKNLSINRKKGEVYLNAGNHFKKLIINIAFNVS